MPEAREPMIGQVDKPDGPGKWEPLKVVVDSGAFDSVAPKEMCPHIRTKDTEASRQGRAYRVANNTRIPICWEKRIPAKTEAGDDTGMRFTIVDVSKPLGAVREMMKKNKKVVFDDSGSYILDKVSGKRIDIVDDGWQFSFQLWIWNPEPPKVEHIREESGVEAVGGTKRTRFA